MSNVLAVLFLVASVLFVWGVVSPRSLSNFSRKPLTRRDAGLGFGVISVVLFALIGVTTPQHSTVPGKSPSTPAATQATVPDAQAVKAATVRTEQVDEEEEVPFARTTREDAKLLKGTQRVTTAGVPGKKKVTYKITYTDGQQTTKEKIGEVVTLAPVDEVTSIGTYVKPAATKPRAATQQVMPNVPASPSSGSCDPNYSGGCVPDVYPEDVDCASGNGNGPHYFSGRGAIVIGTDRYGLNNDDDNLICESN